MDKMKEDLLQYAWQFKLFDTQNLRTVDGDVVQIVDVGRLNRDAGPDFFNAKIRIGGTLWAGNVEVHRCASDWMRHHHDRDPVYDSVMLHVVAVSDVRIHRKSGEVIPQLVLPVSPHVIGKYEQFQTIPQWIRCERLWGDMPDYFWQIQLNRFASERICRRVQPVLARLRENRNNWSDTLYHLMARGFGMHTNALPFELLAKSLPLVCIAKHKSNVAQVEALLFGQASLLSPSSADSYEQWLWREYQHLRNKFGLTPIDASLWRFARMRPQNFPFVRIAQFASLLCRSDHLFSRLVAVDNVGKMKDLLVCESSEYWSSHYRFGVMSGRGVKRMRGESVDLLIINSVIPVLMAYAIQRGDEGLQERLLSFLEQIPSEHNHIIEGWKSFGVRVENAYQSQALIELKRQYCDEKRCLQCSVGHKLLTVKSDGTENK